jgi:hypothetical protein
LNNTLIHKCHQFHEKVNPLEHSIMLEPGLYHVQWDGVGDNGSPLESGTYMYVLGHAGQTVQSGNFMIRE